MTNEMTQANQTAVAQAVEVTVRGNYEVTKDAQGKYKRKTIYKELSTVKASSREEKIGLMNILNGNDDAVTQMKSVVGKQIKVMDIIVSPYDKINEESGAFEYGAVTYLFDESGEVFVTSSKSVYHTLQNAFVLFGTPADDDYIPMIVEIIEKQGQQHKFIDIKVVG